MRFFGLLDVVWDVLFQKLRMEKLGHIDDIGGPADNLTCIVTGPTSGIGRETAAALVRRHARVVLACRSLEKGKQLKQELELQLDKDDAPPIIEVMHLDLASLASVRAFAAKWQQSQRPLHALVNNAGMFALGARRHLTPDGLEAHVATNHLAPFLLSMLLLPSLLQSGTQDRPARIVHVASKMHELAHLDPSDPTGERAKRFSAVTAYSQSKLMQVTFAAELRRRVPPGSHIVSVALHPGEVLTDVVRSLPGWMQALYRGLLKWILLTPEQGARSSVYCATSIAAFPPAQRLRPEHCYVDSNCKPRQPNRDALDPALGRWLWQWSAEKTGLPKAFDLPEKWEGDAG